jgi:hypothetical protein
LTSYDVARVTPIALTPDDKASLFLINSKAFGESDG